MVYCRERGKLEDNEDDWSERCSLRGASSKTGPHRHGGWLANSTTMLRGVAWAAACRTAVALWVSSKNCTHCFNAWWLPVSTSGSGRTVVGSDGMLLLKPYSSAPICMYEPCVSACTARALCIDVDSGVSYGPIQVQICMYIVFMYINIPHALGHKYVGHMRERNRKSNSYTFLLLYHFLPPSLPRFSVKWLSPFPRVSLNPI